MPLRIRNYVDNFHMEQMARQVLRLHQSTVAGPADRHLQRQLALECGAPGDRDLVTAGASEAGDGIPGIASRADSLFAGDGYLLLDRHRIAADDLKTAMIETGSFPG